MGSDVEKRFATELNRLLESDRGLELDPRAQARRMAERREQLRRFLDELTGTHASHTNESWPGRRTAVDEVLQLLARASDATHEVRAAFANLPWHAPGTGFDDFRALALLQVVSRLSERKLRRATLGAAEPTIAGRLAHLPDHAKSSAGTALWRAAERRAATLFRHAQDAGDVASEDPVVDEALARCGRGEPLPAALRAEMERALGASLDRVRVHTDAVAAAAARAVRASAFTVGEDIFFADGAFAPNSEAGRQLLAHELTHVVQAYQGRTARPHSGIEISRPEHPLEREAEANAARLSDPRARGSESRSGSQASPVATGTPPHGTLLLRQEAPASSTSSASETGGTRPREERGGALATSASFEVHGFRAGPSTAGESGPVSDGRRMLVHVQSGGLAASAHVRALTADAQRYTVGFVQTMHHSNRRALYLDYDGHVVATYVASRGRVMDQRTDLGAPRPWYTHGVLLGERSQNPRMSDNPTWEVPRYAEDNSSLVARLEGSEAFTTYLVAMVGNDPSTIVYLGNVQWEVNWAGRFDDRLRFHGHAAHIEPAVRSDQGNAVLSGEPANVGSFGRFEQSRGAASSTSSTTRSAHGGGSGYGHLSDEAVASARTATHVPEGGNEVETPRGRRHLDLSERNAERVAALLEDPAVRAHIEETLEMFENDPDHPIPRSEIDLPLVLATAMREGGPELALSSSEHRIVSAGRDAHTLGRSGMDFLYDLRSRFPRAIRDQIQRVHGNPAVGGEFRRASTNPAYIRERDMLAAHIIEARHREQRFRRLFARSFSDRQGFTEEQRAALLASMSLDARRAWVQASFGSRLPQLLTEARTRITRALRAGRTFEEVAADPSVNLCSIITDDSIMSGNLSRQRTRVTAAEARLINEVLPPELRYGPIAGAEAESAAPGAASTATGEERAMPTPAEIEAAAATSAAPTSSDASTQTPASSDQAIARSAVTRAVPSSVPEEVQHALATETGSPLPDAAEWSERVGHDVSQSRIVTSDAAAVAARAIGARAFTVGNRVFFGEGHGPTTDGGDLLAHELTHVAQQAGATTPASWDQLQFVEHEDAREQAARAHDGEALAAGSEQAIARETSPASADPTAQARAQMRAALPLVTTRWKLVGGDVFDDTGKAPMLSEKVFGHTAYTLIVQDQVDLAPVMAALGGPGREKHLKAFQAAGNAFMADKPHLEALKRAVDNLRAGGQIQYNATRVMAHQAMLSPYGQRALASLAQLGTGELDAYIAGDCRAHGEMERPGGGGELRVKGCQAILGTLRTGAAAELPAPPEADPAKAVPAGAPAESPEVVARAKVLTHAISKALARRKSLAAGGTLTLSPPEQALLQNAIDEAGPDARALVWSDTSVVAQLAQVLDPKQAKNILDRLDPVEALYRSCDEAIRQDEDPYARLNTAQLPPAMAEEAQEGVRLKVRSNVFQVLRTWLNAHARNQPLRMRVLQHTKLKDNFVDRLPDEDQRLIYRLIVRGSETATPEDMVHEAADKNDALGVIRGIRALAGSDPGKLAALERDPTFRASIDRMTTPVGLPDGQQISPYQLCMMMWGRRPDERMDPNAIQQTEINPDPGDDAPLTIPERLRLDRELFDAALTELNDEITGKNLDVYQRQILQQYHQRLGDPQHVMDTLVKYDRMAATEPVRGLLRREKLVFGAELEKRYFQRFGQPLRTWIYENSGPNNRSGSDRVLGLEQGAGVGMFNGQIVMAGEAAVPGKMSLQQALRETVYAGKPIYEHASVQSRELSRALDRSDLGGVNGAWCYFEAAVEACKAELQSLTGITIRAIDLMRNAYMEHAGHLETRLALKFKGDDLAFLRRSMGLKPGLDDDPNAGGPSVAEQAQARFGGISKSVWDALNALSAASAAFEYTAACMLLQVGRNLPAITDAPNAPPAPPQTTAVGHDQEERPPRSFVGFYRAQYGAHPDRHAAAVIRAMGNGKRAVPAERAAEMLKIDVGLVTGPVVADAEDSSIGPHNRHLVRADFTTEKARSNARQIWQLLHVNDGKLATIESELYGPYNDEEQRLIRVEFRKLSGGFDLTFYIQQAIVARERTLREAHGSSGLAYGALASTNDWVIAERAKHSVIAIGAEGTAEGKTAVPLGGSAVMIHGSATELDAALAVASHGELDAVDRVRNAVARGEDTEVLRIIDDLSVDERRQVLKNGKLIDDLERKLGQRDYERVFKVLTGQADLADRLYNNSIGRSWWKRHISHAADSSGMKEDVREYIRRLRLDFDRKVRAELAAKFGPQDTPPPPELIEQEINNRTRAACMDLAADKDIKQIIDDVLGSSDRAEIKSTLMNAGNAQDWAVAAGASKTEILGEIKAMSDEERKAKLADPAYLQLLGKRLHDEKDYRDAMNALAAGQDGVGGKDGTTGAGGLAKLDETSRTSVEIHGAKTDGRATLRALAALSRAELDRLAADPQMQLQVMNALSDDTQRALARELLFPAGSALPKSATGLDPQDAARLDHLVRQAVSRLRIACKTSRKWSAVLEEAVEVYKAPLDPASEPERANDTTAAPKNRVPAGLRAEIWKQVLADITAFAADHDAHRGAVTTDDITGAQMIEVARKAVMHEADPSDWLISAKIWTKEERLGGMSSGEASIVGMMVDDEYEESDLINVLSSASDEHVAREWSSVASEPSGGGETMADRYRIFRASFAKAKAAILRREAATDAAASKASSAPSATSAGDVAAEPTGAGASEPAAAQAPKWSGQVHELRDDDPDILRAEEDKQRFLLYVIQVSRQLEKMLRPFMGDHREVTPDRDPNAAKISGTGNKRYDNLAEIVLARFPRLDPKIIADVIGVEPEDRWILSTAARTEIGMFNLRHEKNLRSRGQQTSERSVASDEKEGLDVSRVVYGRALAVGLTDAQLDKDEVANISHLGDRNDQARDSYKVALETAAMWASLIVGTLVTVVATILTGGLALGPVAAMAVGAATAALSATAKSYVNKQILDNEWDSKDTNELIAHEVLTSVVTIGTTYYAQKFLATLGGLSSAARQATAARAVLAKQPPLWRVFLDQASEQVASEAMSTVVEAGLEATDPKHWIDGYREGSDEAMAAGKARLAAAPEAMARGVVTSLLTASVGKMLRPGGGSHVDFSDAAKQTRSINLARNIKKVFGDPEQKLTGALVEWAMNHEDPIDWSEAPAQLFQGTLNQYGQVATEMHSHTASVAAHGRHAKTQLALYGHEMTAAERAGYEHMNKDAGATDPLISAREYTNLRRQVAETGLGQWEAAHPDHPLDPAQREAFIRWVREAENPDVLKDRAKKNPLDVDVVRDAAPKPASAAPGGAGDAAPGAAHHAGMFHIDANTSVPTTGASQGESHPSQRKTQQMEVPEEQLHPSQRKTQQMEVPEDQLDPAQRRVHEQTPEEQLHPSQRKTQQMEVPEAAIAMSRDVAKEFAVLRDYSVSEDAIGAHQRRQAEEILQRLPEHDYRTFQGLYAHLPTPVGKAFLLKGLAAGHPMNVLHWLVSNMQGRDDYWLIDALTLHDPRGIGVGITQQHSMGCNSSMTMAVQGAYDPVFALGLRINNRNVSQVDVWDPSRFNTDLAARERAMLESGYQGNNPMGQKGLGGEAVPVAWGERRGRWADDLLNGAMKRHEIEYETKLRVAPDEAVRMLDTALAQGLHVPVVISDDPTKYKHYVVVTARFDSGAGVYYRFHNTADGKAVWVMQHQIASGQMPLNGGTMITAIEQPRRAGSGGGAAESRAPAVPQVATAAMQAVTQRMPAQVAAQVINAEMGTQAATPDAAHAASPPPTSTEAAQRPTLVMPAVQDAVAELVHPQAQAATAELMQPRQPGTRQRTGDPERDVFTDKWKDRQVDAAQLRRKYDFEYDDAVDKINRVKANPEVAAVLARVPEAELVAILLYTSTHFVEMNKALRTADASKLDDVGDAIALASAGLEKMPVYQGWTYRGVDSLPAEVLAKYVPGQTVTEEAFTSSSYAESGQYAGNVQFRIKSKDGRLVESLSRYDNEKEVLFKPGSKFKVVDKERDGDRVVITMEEVEGDGGAVAPGAAPRSRAEQSDLGERTPGVRAHETATRAASGEDAPQTRTTHPEAAVEVEHKTVRERTWTGTDTRSRSAPTDRQAHVPVLDHGAAVLNRLSPGIGERLARAKQPVLEAQHQLDKLTTERDELAGQSWQWNEGYLKDHPHERTAVAKAKERAAEVDAEIAALERKLPVLRDRALNEIAVHMEKLRKALQTGTKQDAQEAKQIGNTFPISSDAQSMLAKQSTKHSFNAEQYLRDQIASYNRMTRKGPRGDGFEIVAEEAKADHYNADKKQLNFYVTLNANYHTAAALKEALTRAVFHEMTHHWEYADRETSKASHQWRGARAEAAGTPDPVDVQLKPADAASKGGVIKALLGDFLWEYVGRLYPGKPSTEVYTEGVERFATGKQMAELFAIDPEQFYLVLGTLK